MKNLSLNKIAAATGVGLAAFALAAFAASWTQPPCADPAQCNVDAPINVGSTTQKKMGALGIGKDPTTGSMLDVKGKGLFDDLAVLGKISTVKLNVSPGQTTEGHCTAWYKLPYKDVNDGNCKTWTITTATVNTSGLVLTGDSSGNVTWQPLSNHTISINTTQTSSIVYPNQKCAAGEVVSGISYATNGNIVGAWCSTVSITISN